MKSFRLLLGLSTLCLAGCGSVSDAWLTGWTDSAANDRIMLVRAEPPSFGYGRLSRQTRLYPDLSVFVASRGLPGFIAEITNRNQHYVILYYLADREAFACRTSGAGSRQIEFAGPYPITPREFKTLEGFRNQAEQARNGN
ncbi:MAG: hypothetical protein CFE26_09895 [Verrucomicrobiales bacterium VVV1]|nr:MAG: hypothetical protein CFE26_09895 [Verrucomicrobiales bacterium VVV1]